MRRSPQSPGRRAPVAAAVPPLTGGFAVRASKTIAAPAAAAFAAWTEARRRSRWLAGVKPVVRKAVAPKSVHLTCEHGTHLEVLITPRGRAKCAVAVEHTKLPSAEEAAQRKICWAQLLGGLKDYLER